MLKIGLTETIENTVFYIKYYPKTYLKKFDFFIVKFFLYAYNDSVVLKRVIQKKN